MKKDGLFQGFFPVSRLISTFPSLSDCAFSDIFNTPIPQACQRFHYDKKLNKIIGGVSADLGSPSAFEKRMHVAFTKKSHHMAAYLWPLRTFKKEVVSTLTRFWEEKNSPDFYAYLLGTDAILHMSGPIDQALIFLNDRLIELQTRYQKETGQKLEIILLSDHGNNFARHGKRIKIKKFLKNNGWHLSKTLKNKKDIVLVSSGPLNSIEVFTFESEISNVADLFTQLPGCDIVSNIDPEDPHWIHIANSQNQKALLIKKPGTEAYKYKPIFGDPLGYKPLHKTGFLSAKQWLELTASHEYPAALERIYRGHTSISKNSAPILVSLKDGYENTNGFVKKFFGKRLGGTHGGLAQKSSAGILMTNFRPTPEMTTRQVGNFFKWSHFANQNLNKDILKNQ